MAKARLLSRTLGSSRKFALTAQGHKLGEFAQLLFTLLIPHTDDFGRMDGDAFTVKHAVFPTSPRRIAEFASALRSLHESGLIVLYHADEKECLQVVDFDRHQGSLHKRTKSLFPEPPGNSRKFPELREIPGRTDLDLELKRTDLELKRTEGSVKLPEPLAADAAWVSVWNLWRELSAAHGHDEILHPSVKVQLHCTALAKACALADLRAYLTAWWDSPHVTGRNLGLFVAQLAEIRGHVQAGHRFAFRDPKPPKPAPPPPRPFTAEELVALGLTPEPSPPLHDEPPPPRVVVPRPAPVNLATIRDDVRRLAATKGMPS